MLSYLQVLHHLVLITVLGDGHYYTHFTDEEILRLEWFKRFVQNHTASES